MLANEIIDKFGGQSALAKAINKRQSTIQHWYNNRIPAKWQGIILGLAKKQGIKLKAEDFLDDPTIPKATHQGKLEIGDISIPCFVLEDSTRVISGRSLTKSIGMKGRGQGAPRITAHKSLKLFINNELSMAINNPITFLGVGNRNTSGYEATILQDHEHKSEPQNLYQTLLHTIKSWYKFYQHF